MLKIPTPELHCPALLALSALAVESAFEYQVALVGGAVRNASNGYPDHGITDHDIAVFGPDACNDDAVTELEIRLEQLGYNEIARFSESGEYADGELWLVVKYDHPVYPDVDLLVHPNAQTLEEVLATFDFNINQYSTVIPDPLGSEEVEAYYAGGTNTQAIAANGGPLQGDLLHPEGQPPEQPMPVLQLLNFVQPDRMAKMLRVADWLGWSVPPSYRPPQVNEDLPFA